MISPRAERSQREIHARERHHRAALSALATGLLLSCCSAKPATAIVLAISTEGSVPRDLDRLEVAVKRGGSDTFDTIVSVPQGARLPGTLTLKPEGGEGAITIEIRGGRNGAAPHVVRRATLGFVDQKQKLLRLALRYSCFGNTTCDAGQSCVGGACAPDPTPDPNTLPDFASDAFDTCFSESQCFASASELALDSATCSVPLPNGQSLGATFAKWPDRQVVVIPDANEGYTRQGSKAVLAHGLCGLAKAGAITAFFSSSCAEIEANRSGSGSHFDRLFA